MRSIRDSIGDAEEHSPRVARSSVARSHPPTEAEECFLKALDLTRQQQAKSDELKVSISLARLWQQQGKTQQAHKLLSDIYHWFTEGFDTKDLREAKALLEELQGEKQKKAEGKTRLADRGR